MKKAIALTLALVLALGMLTACGTTEVPAATETPAAAEVPAATEAPAAAEAPAATEAPAAAEAPAVAEVPAAPAADGLRAGESVLVSTKEEFAAAYAKIFEEGSTVNEIKLGGNIAITGSSDRPEGGNDPHMTKYPGYICVRMPEGTRLDLNGCKLTLRGLQGLDDNTGKATKKRSLGTVIDSFGGGSIQAVSLATGNSLSICLALAKECPLVTTVSFSSECKNADKLDLVVPENVKLSLTSEKSKLSANSLTLKSGATIEVKKSDAPGVAGTKAVIFECKNEADHSRAGIEFATEVKDV